jgi:FAD:protein FMN transferase
MRKYFHNPPVYPAVCLLAVLMVMLLILSGCGKNQELLFSGKTMGTTYHIKVVADSSLSRSKLAKKITALLNDVNQSMSTFIKESEISRFNSISSNRERLSVSTAFFEIVAVGMDLYKLTDGAWDGTVKPLVNLWGFGTDAKMPEIPTEKEIRELLRHIGFDKIQMDEEGRYLSKKDGAVTLDLASIAKGYGVDTISRMIRKSGIENFLVEIGGEVFASGLRMDGKPWRVGINKPRKDAGPSDVYTTLHLENRALATSGDYRNFFDNENRRYSHILDPRTGYPVNNRVVSVSVIAGTCTAADGLATAMMVMGPEKGLELTERLQNVESLIIVETEDGALRNFASKNFFSPEKNE